MTTIKAEFGIYDFKTNPTVITEILEISPSNSHAIGQEYMQEGTFKIAASSFWSYTKEFDEVKAEDGITQMLELINQRAGILKHVLVDYNLELSIVVESDLANPGLHFNNKQLSILNTLGCELDIDIYVID